jgi:hypothetical protein
VKTNMISRILLCVLAATLVCAHPGEDHDHIKREAEELNIFAKRASSLLSSCSDSTVARAIQEENIARRLATARSLMKKRGLKGISQVKKNLKRNLLTAHSRYILT